MTFDPRAFERTSRKAFAAHCRTLCRAPSGLGYAAIVTALATFVFVFIVIL